MAGQGWRGDGSILPGEIGFFGTALVAIFDPVVLNTIQDREKISFVRIELVPETLLSGWIGMGNFRTDQFLGVFLFCCKTLE